MSSTPSSSRRGSRAAGYTELRNVDFVQPVYWAGDSDPNPPQRRTWRGFLKNYGRAMLGTVCIVVIALVVLILHGMKPRSDSTPNSVPINVVLFDFWPQSRFDCSKAGYAALASGPRRGSRVRWQYLPPIPHNVSSEPVVSRENVLLSHVCNETVAGVGSTTLLALNATTGEFLWSRLITTPEDGAPCVLGAPVVLGFNRSVAYTHPVDGLVVADLVSGVVHWRLPSVGFTVRSLTTFPGGHVLVYNIRATLSLVDATRRSVVWATSAGNSSESAAAVSLKSRRVFVASQGWSVSAARAQKAPMRLPHFAPGSLVRDLTAASLAVGTGAMPTTLSCLNLTNGHLLWQQFFSAPITATPAVGPDGSVFVTSLASGGWLFAINGTTGIFAWGLALGANSTASPSVDANGVVYAPSRRGVLFAVDSRSGGRLLWTFHSVARAPLLTDPAIDGHGMLFVTDAAGWAYGINSRSPLVNVSVMNPDWSFLMRPPVRASGPLYVTAPVVSGPYTLVSAVEGSIVMIDDGVGP